jgi:hypothetical protein
MELKLEIKDQEQDSGVEALAARGILIAPPIEEGFWKYRVCLSKSQAIVGFPKFGTIGIGFEKEKDWNTNLPYTCDAEEIYSHIKHNKGPGNIQQEDCIQAIKMIQEAIEVNQNDR